MVGRGPRFSCPNRHPDEKKRKTEGAPGIGIPVLVKHGFEFSFIKIFVGPIKTKYS